MDKKALLQINNKGYSLIELITAMAIMALLGSALFTMVSSGGKSYQRIQKAYMTQNDARVAMSYIVVKIRQNDNIYVTSTSPVAITAGVSASSNMLRIRDPLHPPPSEERSWWIYKDGANLMEKYCDDPTTGTGSAIAVVDSFTVDQLPKTAPADPTRLEIKIGFDDGNDSTPDELSEVVSLRADSP